MRTFLPVKSASSIQSKYIRKRSLCSSLFFILRIIKSLSKIALASLGKTTTRDSRNLPGDPLGDPLGKLDILEVKVSDAPLVRVAVVHALEDALSQRGEP